MSQLSWVSPMVTRQRFWSWSLWLGLAIVSFFLSSLLGMMPVKGQSTNTAPITLDGRDIFSISSIPEASAQERANYVHQILAQELQWEQPMQLAIVDRNQQVTIQLNDRHLLTVTKSDVVRGMGLALGDSPETELDSDTLRLALRRQASLWQSDLEFALWRFQYERTSEYLGQALLQTVVLLGLTVLGQHGLRILTRRLGRPVTAPGGQLASDMTRQLGLTILQISLWIAVTAYITQLFPQIRQWRYLALKVLERTVNSPLVTLGERGYSVANLFAFVAIVLVLWLVVRSVIQLLKSRVLRATGIDPSAQDTISVLVQYALIFLGMLTILQSWGVDVRSLAILASVFGIGISLGLQNTANNFISGLLINFERPVKRGDLIQLGDLIGTVERIGPRSTEILTLDQVSIIVPNARFLESEVVNWSHGNPVSRLQVPVGVAYGTNVRLVQRALLEASRDHPEILRYPVPQVWFQEFGDSALNFKLLVWICDPRKQFKIRSELNYRIEASLRRYNIEVPFPQRDVHLRSPLLEKALALWLQQHQPPAPTLYYPHVPAPTTVEEEEFWVDLPADEPDLIALASQMRGPAGVDIQDRRYGLRIFRRCFVGSEAVDWLVRTQRATREAATQLGQRLLEKELIHHVIDEHDFQDAYLFYRFYADEQDAEVASSG